MGYSLELNHSFVIIAANGRVPSRHLGTVQYRLTDGPSKRW